jgi:hypothetical protein
MEQDEDVQGHGILHLEPCPSGEPILLADEGMEYIARLYQLLVALVIPLGDLKPRPDVREVGGK